MLRTHTCGQLTSQELNQTVTLCGRVDTVRKLGGMTFVDLRDRYGLTQINFDPSKVNADLIERATKLRLESVVQITGVVISRPDGMTNAEMVTGEIEVQPTSLEVLSQAGELPFSINHENAVSEELRLEHRYLDLRRQSNREMLRLRHHLTIDIMNFFDAEGFTYIETPTFVKNTPEGAKEYIVPTSSHPGKFFVLPQSPQQLKQLSMVAGVDRYYQLARCYRDEPLRGDRQPEFTQLDLEMSFVEQEDVLELLERHFVALSTDLTPDPSPTSRGEKTLTYSPFLRLTRDECMNTYGIDKPELRTQAMQLIDLTTRGQSSDFSIFQSAPVIKAICVPKVYSRSEIDKTIIPLAQQKGAKGVAWLSYSQAEGWKGSILKFFDEKKLEELKELLVEESPLPPFQRGAMSKAHFDSEDIKKRGLVCNGYHLPYNIANVSKAKELRKNMTTAEKKLWYEFLCATSTPLLKGGSRGDQNSVEGKTNEDMKIRTLRQQPIDHYIVDFYIASVGLVIEIDGDSHVGQEAYDQERTQLLETYGLTVMRFTNDEVMNHFEEVCEKIQGYCNHSTQTQVQKESEFTLFFQADARQQSVEVLGFLRNYFIKDLDLLAGKENELAFAFVTDFPLYEVDPETGDFASVHHPFTKPKLKDIPFVIGGGQKVLEGGQLTLEDKQGLADLRADCYDLVLNGYELGSGSIRITDPVLQTSIFAILGLTQEQINDRFGHMLKAFSFGVPPHGGFAYGLDRVVMIYAGKPNIREVIPYPKNNQGVDLMLRSPGEVDEKILEGVGIVVKK